MSNTRNQSDQRKKDTDSRAAKSEKLLNRMQRNRHLQKNQKYGNHKAELIDTVPRVSLTIVPSKPIYQTHRTIGNEFP